MAPNLERREKSEQIVLRRRTLKLNAGHWHTASILDIRGNDWMTHFNGEGIVRMREELAKLESRQERDLLHRFPPLLVVFSFQTFSEFISYAIFFFKKHLFRKSRARSHIKQKFLTVAKCFADGQNSFGFIICLNTDIFIVVNSTFYRNYCEKIHEKPRLTSLILWECKTMLCPEQYFTLSYVLFLSRLHELCMGRCL